MWELSSFKKTGKYHADHGMLCQDQVFYRENHYSQAIVLADGAGDSDANVPCVEEVAEFAAEALLRFSEGKEEVCQASMLEYLMGGVVEIISKYMDRSHLGAETFGSTLIGAAVNHREGRYLLLHLGDGGDDDAVLPGLFDVVFQALLVDGQINHTYLPSCCFESM